MKILDADSSLGKGPGESRKRRRELWFVAALGVVFLILTWVTFRIFGYSSSLPIEHSIFFLGLVDFNIILFLLLIYLIFRNIVKVFSEKPKGVVGSSLKSKLIAAFVAFSFIPTTLMFFVSVFYINSSFDKWFSERTVSVLKGSLEVMNQYFHSAKKRNYHFADKIAVDMQEVSPVRLRGFLNDKVQFYKLDSIEFYPSLTGERVFAVAEDVDIPDIPPVSLEFRQKGIRDQVEASYVHQFGEGNLVRIVRPVMWRGQRAALVVSSFIPMSVISRINDISKAYEDLRESNPLSIPLKSIYLILLILMTLVILLGATWFGFHLAKQLSIPMEMLAVAAKKLAEEDYHQVKVQSGSPEINLLVSNFNLMSEKLEKSGSQIRQSNENLKNTLAQLDEYTRYVEVVLSNVTTGVISVNNRGKITMVNRHAASLLNIEPSEFIGKNAKDVLSSKYFLIFEDLLKTMKKHRATTIRKEVRIELADRSVPMQMNLSVLYDESGRELGKVLVFDDLTMVVNAQRAAAWTEVARRIAHEIKNPLTPISLAAQRLQRKFGDQIDDRAFTDCVHMIIDQVDGLKTLVNEFSNFARMPQSRPAMNSLGKTIEDSLVLFREAHKNIQFVFEMNREMPDFLFDVDQMKRVFTNLFDNSVSALKGVAAPAIEVTCRYDSQLQIARITVSDNGVGVRSDLRDRIFEPYVTSKMHGTGLGLAIVKRTVEDHNGFIRAFSRQPQGTKIVIELPVIVSHTNDTLVRDVDAEVNNPAITGKLNGEPWSS